MPHRWLLLFSLTASALVSAAEPVTFNKDVAPLVYSRCAPCHHEGGIGPFPLLSYEDVRKHATQIARVTQSRYMPPWPPDPSSADFLGDRHLTVAQIQLIADWVKAGHPEGADRAAPAPPTFNNQWQMGPPDLVIRMPEPFSLPASGPDLFRNFVIPTGGKDIRYVRGFELRLNDKRAVHHANVVLDRTQSLRRRDREDGRPGFPGMDVTTEAAPNDFDPDSHFLFWKPATVIQPQPADMSWRLDPGTDLILNLHLQPTGEPEQIQAEIGLYFTAQPPTRHPMLIQLEHDGALRIPPGARAFTVEDHLTLPVNVDLLAIYPHAHYLGKVIEAWATLPNGSRRSLIRIPDWDINWQGTYEYRQPIYLPKGTTVAMRISYDNSPANIRNPNNPPILVEAGNRSQDEMGHVWLQVLPRTPAGGEDGRWALQQASMERRLQKYPDDFLAHYNLGAFQQSAGRLDEAARSYRQALQLDRKNATVRNSLGTVLMQQDRWAEAIEQLQDALRLDSQYLNARFNLGRSLAATGDLPAAEAQFTQLLAAKPDDGPAQQALASICLAEKRYEPALMHLTAAAQLNPADAELQGNLGALLAMTGNLPAAVQAFETALKLNPDQPVVRKNLDRARAQLARASR